MVFVASMQREGKKAKKTCGTENVTSASSVTGDDEEPSLLMELFMSAVNPGVTPKVRSFLNGVFVALFVSLALLYFAAKDEVSIHIYILIGLALGLFLSLSWYGISLPLLCVRVN